MDDWASALTLNIGKNVKLLRGTESGQWLADRTKELGYPIARSSLSELENGKRRVVTVPDLLVLSAALDVPPAVLLFREIPDSEVEVLPGVRRSSWQALQWLAGKAPTPGENPRQTKWLTLIQLIELRESMLRTPWEEDEFWDPLDRGGKSNTKREWLNKLRKEFSELEARIKGLGGILR